MMAAAAALLMAPVAADAAVVYSFSTNEPFAGGTLSFTYQADDYVGDTGFIERSALTNVVGNIDRIRFQASCPFGGGPAACDQVTVVAGFTTAYRYFTNGAFAAAATYQASVGTAATLTVAPAAPAGVPEPATWAMLIGGLGATGTALRRRRRVALAA